jgi:hypothetical protein
MTKLSLITAVLAILMLSPVVAEDAILGPAPAEWQAVISSQIQAFRDKDAPGALSYAGAMFKAAYADPRQFFMAIIASGYAPIMESRSHSFGAYRLTTPEQVFQDVKLVGNDQGLYEAIYELDKEPEGWRVHGVQLVKTPGFGV